MSFKKILTSDGNPVVIGSTKSDESKFPPGFSYRIEGMIYTVKSDVTQETSSPMREVTVSDGSTEIILVESIMKDLKEPGCEILPLDMRFAKKGPVKKTTRKVAKKKKKKTTKKKAVKKKKND